MDNTKHTHPFSMWFSTRYERLTMFSALIPEAPDTLQSIHWLEATSSESDVAATGNQWTITHGPRSKTHHINLRKSKPWTHVCATRLKKSLMNPKCENSPSVFDCGHLPSHRWQFQPRQLYNGLCSRPCRRSPTGVRTWLNWPQTSLLWTHQHLHVCPGCQSHMSAIGGAHTAAWQSLNPQQKDCFWLNTSLQSSKTHTL